MARNHFQPCSFVVSARVPKALILHFSSLLIVLQIINRQSVRHPDYLDMEFDAKSPRSPHLPALA